LWEFKPESVKNHIIGRYDGYRSFRESGIEYAMKSTFAVQEDAEAFGEKEGESRSKRQSLLDSINEKFERLAGRITVDPEKETTLDKR
jgi:hypothetical protein